MGRGGLCGLSDNGAQTVPWKHPGVLAAVIGAAVVIIIALAAALGVERSIQPPPYSPTSPGCPENWIRIQGKFYYFSKAEGNWTDSQKNCSSHAAFLATIESLQQLASLVPYPGRLDHWIGLRKDAVGVWRWVNGTEFDHRFEIRGGADCAYLDRDLNVSSSSCSRLRRWLCSKPNTPL
ncbi:C-type lectin domain family 2 member D-like isoform X5 [Pelodiscus sinensis]|uniref:C-type lectin domain family 2 member D-like isoform X5 n=1 Tax=Pelodiscus sinensis TaxID=13735 RepID=UPI003F6B32AC